MYVFLIFWLFLLGFVCQKMKNGKKIFLLLFFGFCTLLMGLRSTSVGIDTLSYSKIFNTAGNYDWNYIFSSKYGGKMEFGYAALMKLCSSINNSYYFFQFVVSGIICFGTSKFIKDNIDEYIIPTIIFIGCGFFVQAFSITRQYLAVVIVMNSWTYMKQNKKIKSLVLLYLATTIHSSAWVFIITYLIYIFRKSKFMLLMIVGILLACVFNFDKISPHIEENFENYSMYATNSLVKIEAGGIIFMWIAIAIVSVLVFKTNKTENNIPCIEAVLSFLFVAFSFFGTKFNYVDRIGYYFLPFVILTLSRGVEIFKNNSWKLLYKLGISFSFAVYFFLSVTKSMYMQYSFFFK